ncbi:hypothetical protein [Pseudomonas gingeri]|nr:hypothetical protein [Pseudomonas gingeri]
MKIKLQSLTKLFSSKKRKAKEQQDKVDQLLQCMKEMEKIYQQHQ